MANKSTFMSLLLSAIFFVTAVGGLRAEAENSGEGNFHEDFQDSQAAYKKLDMQPENWTVSEGVLTSRNKSDAVVSFQFGKPVWRNYDLQLKVKRLAINSADQHFGVRIRSSELDSGPVSFLQFYCRGGSIIMMENAAGKTMRHDSIGDLAAPLEVGPNARWTTFRISITDSIAKVYVNGSLLGTVQDVVPRKGFVSLYAYGVVVQIDDIDVTVLTTEDNTVKGLEPSRNVVSNSSFEYCTQDDLPDYWGCPHWGIEDPFWSVNFERWTKSFRTDTGTAFDGVRSMYIDSPVDGPSIGSSGLCLRSVLLGTAANEQYVLSAYMKCLLPGMKVNMAGKEVTLSKDWQRYSVGFKHDGQSYYADMINIYPITKGTCWVDAVQLEKGSEPTPYVPSLRDTILLAQVKGEKKTYQAPSCTPKKAVSNIKLDGLLHEADWSAAQKLDFHLLNGGTPVESSYAKITYTTKGIYVGVYCKDAAAASAKCLMSRRDGTVWNDPSIEIFIDPKLSKTDYYHFAFNKNGIMCDASNADIAWNCSWKTATHIGDGFWSAEAFLPFNELGIDGMAGQTWGINVCRSNPQVNEYTCWSPTFAGFHTPDRFGEIKLDSRVFAEYRMYIKNAGLSLISTDTCSLSMNVVNATNKDSHLLLKVSPDSSNKFTIKREVNIGRDSNKHISFGKLKLIDARAGIWRVSLFTADGKNMLYSSQISLSCPAVIEMTPQFTLYTSEKQMRIRLRLGLAEQMINKAAATIIISKDGKEQFRRKLLHLSKESFIIMPVAELPNGRYSLSVNVVDRTGRVISSASRIFEKLAPQSNEVKIDRLSRIVTVDGKPFVPIGPAWEGALPLELLKYLADSGCNTICVFYGIEQLGKLLDDAGKCGLKVKVGFSAKNLEEARKYINTYKQHPALLAWDIFDEMFTMEWGKNNYKLISEACSLLKSLDPYHPVYINENDYGLAYLKSKGLDFPGEIISLDYYAYPPSGNVQAIGEYAKQMYQFGRSESKPCWIYSFASGYAFGASRDLTPQEQVCSTYTSFVNGVTGLFYWASHPKSKSQWNRIKELMSEIKQLTPAIASALDVSPTQSSSPVVQTLTKKHNNALYVITINTSREPVSAKLDISSSMTAKRANRVDVMFENRSVAVHNGVINDRYAGFERHVYLVKLK